MANKNDSTTSLRIIKTTVNNVEYTVVMPRALPSKNAFLSSEKAIFPYQSISKAFEEKFLNYISMDEAEFEKKVKLLKQSSESEAIADFLDLDIEKLFDVIVDNSGLDTVTVSQSRNRGKILFVERSLALDEMENDTSKFKKIESIERDIYTESRDLVIENLVTVPPPITTNNGVPAAIALIAGPLVNFNRSEFELRSQASVTLTGNIFNEGASVGPDGLNSIDLNFTRTGSVKTNVIAGIQITTPEGNTMVLYTSLIPLLGIVAGDYVYTLSNPVSHIPGPDVIVLNHPQLGQIFVDVFNYTIIDSNYDSSTSTISVQIVDDIAEAYNNLNTVNESLLFVNGTETVSGNLFTDNDGFGIDLGADGLHITSVNGVTDGGVGDLDGANGSIKTHTDYNTGTGIVTGELTVDTATGAYTFELIDASAISDAELTTQHVSTYTVADADGDTSSANLTITVTLNQAPTANDDTASTDEDNPVTVVAPGVLTNDTDPNTPDDTMSVISIDTTGTIGNVTFNANGAITYDPNGQFETLAGGAQTTDSFTYTIEDAEGLSDTATVVVTITGVNDAPVVNDVNASGNEDAASIAIILTGSDVDGTIASFNVSSLPGNGTLYVDVGLTTAVVIATDYAAVGNQLTLYFVPDLNFNGIVSFDYGAKDNLGLDTVTDETATITVNAVNDAPIVNDVNASGNEDAASIAIILTGSDVDGTIASFNVSSLPGNGTLYVDVGLTTAVVIATDYAAVGNQLTLYFVPDLNFNGIVSFDYGAKDNLGLDTVTDETATITVNAVNDAPQINNLHGDILNYPPIMLGMAQLLDQGALSAVLDLDSANFNGGVLTVAITANAVPAEDVLGIQSTVGQIELTGASVTYMGTEIGVVDGASTATQLIINLDADATAANIAALISAITYANTELILPDVSARTVSFTLTDGDGGTSNTADVLVDVGDLLPPVVLDLQGDGIELISPQNSNVTYEKNGLLFKIGWVGPNDAILAYDANHDGLVTDFSELNLSLYHPDAKTDLEGLQLAFDSNQDGIFDAADEHFQDFLIWQDLNQDGVSQTSEITTLANSNIKAIHLDSDHHKEIVEGNIIFGTTTYETKQGDILFASDLGLTILPVDPSSNPKNTLVLSDIVELEPVELAPLLQQEFLAPLVNIVPGLDEFALHGFGLSLA